MSKLVHIIGGGTVAHVRPHFALCAPAYGSTARWLWEAVVSSPEYDYRAELHLTKMADPTGSKLETNEDIAELVGRIVSNPPSKIVFMSAALCDFEPFLLQTLDTWEPPGTIFGIGKEHPRLKTSQFKAAGLGVLVKPSDKIIGKIREWRKDIFLVGFKTTSGVTPDEQFMAGLGLLKGASCNLVLANDIKTRHNMIITPEEARYASTDNREEVLKELLAMTVARSQLTFTRSEVVEKPLVQWDDERIPDSLRTVVNHCIKRGAYKPFNGATVGHFAVNLPGPEFITSIRKSNFNNLAETGMVFAEALGNDRVVAHGAKPSVGGQSQRIIFERHPDHDCIVHFHCPLKKESVGSISTVSQKFFECGSHECGQNTADGLFPYISLQGLETGRSKGGLMAVMLDKHGPNIVFNKNMRPETVIEFIEQHWDLEGSTRE